MTDLRSGSPEPALRRQAWRAVGVVGLAVAGAAAGLPLSGPVPRIAGLALFGIVGWIVLERVEADHPHPRFGWGNRVTLVRAGGASLLAALALAPAGLAGRGAWAACAAAAVLLALDGIDGWAARRQGLVSAFGARFDMEVDALTILALAGLALGLGKAGPWVLGLGLMRYGFVLAGLVRPALTRPLPPSFRRKAVCVIQLAVLTLLLAPPLQPPLSGWLAALALAALAWSFAVDVLWLIRAAR